MPGGWTNSLRRRSLACLGSLGSLVRADALKVVDNVMGAVVRRRVGGRGAATGDGGPVAAGQPVGVGLRPGVAGEWGWDQFAVRSAGEGPDRSQRRPGC